MTRRNQIEQGRAAYAYAQAKSGIDKASKEYLSFVESFPMMIKTNGLGAAMAFAGYKNLASKLLKKQIEEWLQKPQNQHLIDLSNNTPLDKALSETNSVTYRAVASEVFALMGWIRRYAKGLHKKSS